MKRADRVALALVLAILIGVPAGVFSFQALRTRAGESREIFVVARTVERGGWSPARIVVKQGQRVRLRGGTGLAQGISGTVTVGNQTGPNRYPFVFTLSP